MQTANQGEKKGVNGIAALAAEMILLNKLRLARATGKKYFLLGSGGLE